LMREDFERYGRGAMLFHWLMFLLVVGVGILGLLHDSWPKHSQRFWINIHAVFGLFLWLALMGRFYWRITHTPPAPPEDLGRFARRLAGTVHTLLYVLLFITPIVGIVTFIYHGRVLNLGLFQWDFGVPSNRAIFHPTEELHGYLAYALFALAGIHAMAALWHHFVLRNAVLARMWPRTRRASMLKD
jgi:cytochrome b561